MRLRHVVNLRVFEDANEKNFLFGPDKALAEELITNMQTQENRLFRIPAVATPADGTETETYTFSDVTTVRGIYIEASGDCTLAITTGDGVQTIQLRRADTTTGRKARMFLETTGITQVAITNLLANAAVLTGLIAVYGDPTS